MENQNIKRARGRPVKYLKQEDKMEAIKKSKTKYMLNKEWYCDVCNNSVNYTLAGKWCHLKTEKHKLHDQIHEMKKIIDETQ